jgi:hypothetical protein
MVVMDRRQWFLRFGAAGFGLTLLPGCRAQPCRDSDAFGPAVRIAADKKANT